MPSVLSTTTLLALSALALARPQDALPTPTDGLSLPTSANVNAIVSYLLPSITSTSLSPSQSAAILSDAASYVSSYTAANPIQQVTSGILLQFAFAETTPDAAQRSQIAALVQAAPSALANDPAAFVASVDSLLGPFPFIATRVSSYEAGFQQGLATVVAQELSVQPPEPTEGDTGAAGAADEEGSGAAVVGGARPALAVAVAGVAAGALAMLV